MLYPNDALAENAVSPATDSCQQMAEQLLESCLSAGGMGSGFAVQAS